tara:strand:- start:11202 stop:11936 length:735 start_codon:yes stop_codon:yes gene_type:complete
MQKINGVILKNKKILIVVAHPDDIEFRYAGSVAKWIHDQNEVEYCIATSGEKGFNSNGKEILSCEKRQEIRESEQISAAEVVGVKRIHFLKFPDGELENNAFLRKEIVKLIRIFKPQIVVSGDPSMNSYDSFPGYHSDHLAIAAAVFESLYPACGNENFFPELISEEKLMPFTPKLAMFGNSQNADTWTDIEDFFEIKMKALACHKSQIEDIQEIIPRIMERSKEYGKQAGLNFAESFRTLELP